jgi:hypothetical protein
MACRRALPVLAGAAILSMLACSKTQDTAPDPMRFGQPPVIESVNQGGALPLTSEESVTCDFTESWDTHLFKDGPFEEYCDSTDLHPQGTAHAGKPKRKIRRIATYGLEDDVTFLIGGTYTQARFEVRVTDPDSTPEQDNVLLVTASFTLNAGTAGAVETSLIVLDDGSQNLFDYTQKAPNFQANCRDETTTTTTRVCTDILDFDEDGNPICNPPGEFRFCQDPANPTDDTCGPCSLEAEPFCTNCLSCMDDTTTTTVPVCDIATYKLNTNDQIKGDHLFTRGFAFFTLRQSLIAEGSLQDCIAKEKAQAPYSAAGTQTFEFTIEAVDRQGNLTEWAEKLRAEVVNNQFICTGDECLCCFIRTGNFGNRSKDPLLHCEDLPGVYAPEDPSGRCDTEDNPTPAPPPPFDDVGGCFFP